MWDMIGQRVVLSKKYYEQKAGQILQAAPFESIENGPTKQTEQKLNQTLKVC